MMRKGTEAGCTPLLALGFEGVHDFWRNANVLFAVTSGSSKRLKLDFGLAMLFPVGALGGMIAGAISAAALEVKEQLRHFS